MAGDAPFPDRDLILFATFVAIAVSLIGLGLPLPWLVKRLGLTRAGKLEAHGESRAEHKARLGAIDAVLAALDAAEQAGAPTEAVASLRRRHGDRRAHLAATADESIDEDPVTDATGLQLRLVDVERAAIAQAFDGGRMTDAARRRLEREFDLEEARARHAHASAKGEEDE
jgi:CPA1 family monovalent cation:H+ antiporter